MSLECHTKNQGNNEIETINNSHENIPQQNKDKKSDLNAADIGKNRPTSLNVDGNSPKKRNDNKNKAKNKKKNDSKRKGNNSNKKQQGPNDKSEKDVQNSQSSSTPTNSSKSENLCSPIVEKVNDINLDDQQKSLVPTTTKIQVQEETQAATTTTSKGENNTNNNATHNSHKRQHPEANRERRELKHLKERISTQNIQIQKLEDQVKQQKIKTKELETALIGTTKTCNQLDSLLQQELSFRSRLESENESLEQTVNRLKTQISQHEKNKFNSDELMRVLNATLMERETEVSILKLKLTRLQTNPSATVGINPASSISSMRQQDPCQAYATSGRSNSEFDRTAQMRSSIRAQVAANVGASTSQLRSNDKDASVWATVPEELTPSKRPQILEKSFQSIYGDSSYNPYSNFNSLVGSNQISTPLARDRRYKTLPRSMKSPSQEFGDNKDANKEIAPSATASKPYIKPENSNCQITNLDDSNSTSQSSSGNRTTNSTSNTSIEPKKQQAQVHTNKILNHEQDRIKSGKLDEKLFQENGQSSAKGSVDTVNHHTTIGKSVKNTTEMTSTTTTTPTPKVPSTNNVFITLNTGGNQAFLSNRTPTTPVKISSGLKKIFDKFRRSDSSTSNSKAKTELDNTPLATPEPSPFKRNSARSTMVAAPNNIRAQMSPVRQAINFQPDKPFAEWDTDILVDWLNMIGLSMYTAQCRRWVKCGAHIMNATPAEVDKGLGITNHLHRKKLRLAISELNGDCDKLTKAAAKLDYLWVARWLDDMGLPQYKDAFINARIDGRVLNYLTVDDLVSMGVKSVLHHASIRCGIKVLRSIKFDLQQLKRRATADEIEQMTSIRQQINQGSNETSIDQKISNTNSKTDVALWTCHRVMEWLRLIDFAEFAPNLRGSGVHGGLIVFEDSFNIDTMCSLLSIPVSRTLLRRHLDTFFKELIGDEAVQRKCQYQSISSNQPLNPSSEIKTAKKTQWFSKLKSSKVAQDVAMDEYLCPMYPVEPQLITNQEIQKTANRDDNGHHLPKIPESINV